MKMIISDLIEKLQKLDPDAVIIFVEHNGGWTNIEMGSCDNSCVCIVPATNMEK